MYIHICIYIYVYNMYVYICIYVQRERVFTAVSKFMLRLVILRLSVLSGRLGGEFDLASVYPSSKAPAATGPRHRDFLIS